MIPLKGAGFFIEQVNLCPEDGTVPCGLYGPAMDGVPVGDDDVIFEKRGDRDWTDRILKADSTLRFKDGRYVDYVQVIGVIEDDPRPHDYSHKLVTVYTVYGGPLAPQNPKDPSCSDVEASTKFWSEHALA